MASYSSAIWINRIKEVRNFYLANGIFMLGIKLSNYVHRKIIIMLRESIIHDPNKLYVASNEKWTARNDLNCILIVVHEATFSGAPMLALNIGHHFVKDHNLIYLLLRGGDLCEYFKGSDCQVIQPLIDIYDEKMVQALISRLHKEYQIDYVVLNTIETSMFSRPLSLASIPTVSLIHECASLYPSKYQFESLLLWSDISIFSSNFLLDEAINQIRGYEGFNARVMPQGLCKSADSFESGSYIDPVDISERQNELENFISNKKVVLAVGSINYRKGVDLFVGLVEKIVKKSASDEYCFLWVGSAEGERSYELYIKDQIIRSNLGAHIKFISPTNNLNFIYESADVLVLTSRLDALPNVAIDAMHFGLPVVIFESTTGLEEYLSQDLRDLCVSRYLDIADMAIKVIHILDLSADKKNIVSSQLKEFVNKVFSMNHYVAELKALLTEAQEIQAHESEAYKVISLDNEFRMDFYSSDKDLGAWPNLLSVKIYLRTWANKIGVRKPFPGFHPGIYWELNGCESSVVDPYASYLLGGRPIGKWSHGVINPGSPQYSVEDAIENTEVALHIHVFYSNQFLEIMDRLKLNLVRPDLFISVSSQEAKDYVCKQLQTYSGNVIKVEIFPNVGRDIAPLINLFGSDMSHNYKYCGHIHTKSSKWLRGGVEGKTWFTFLIENLLGGVGGPMADKILYAMKSDQMVELVFPDDPNAVGWDKNFELAQKLANSVGIRNLPDNFNFPVGTMFWCKSSLLKKLMKLNIQMADYPREPIPNDGTILHAIERLIPFFMSQSNSQYLLTNVPGITR